MAETADLTSRKMSQSGDDGGLNHPLTKMCQGLKEWRVDVSTYSTRPVALATKLCITMSNNINLMFSFFKQRNVLSVDMHRADRAR
jgi:hypothetical protein